MPVPQITLTEDTKNTLKRAIEFYIRMGLGRFSEIFHQFNILQGDRLGPDKLERIAQLCDEIEELAFEDDKNWKLQDDEISIYTLNAFLLESQMNGNRKDVSWAKKRIKELTKRNKEKLT